MPGACLRVVRVRVRVRVAPFPAARVWPSPLRASRSYVLASLRALHLDPLRCDGELAAVGEGGVWSRGPRRPPKGPTAPAFGRMTPSSPARRSTPDRVAAGHSLLRNCGGEGPGFPSPADTGSRVAAGHACLRTAAAAEVLGAGRGPVSAPSSGMILLPAPLSAPKTALRARSSGIWGFRKQRTPHQPGFGPHRTANPGPPPSLAAAFPSQGMTGRDTIRR